MTTVAPTPRMYPPDSTGGLLARADKRFTSAYAALKFEQSTVMLDSARNMAQDGLRLLSHIEKPTHAVALAASHANEGILSVNLASSTSPAARAGWINSAMSSFNAASKGVQEALNDIDG